MAVVGPKEALIHQGNFQQFLAPNAVVDGEHKATGLVPRPMESHPTGHYKGIPPYWSIDMPLIPESEWSARIKDKVAQKSLLSDIRNVGDNGKPITSRDQNGRGYCVTEDTECLTSRGWVPYPDYNWEDLLATVNPLTHALEYQMPLHRHVYEYDGEMIYSTNRRLDFGVTPDHRMYVRKWDESRRTLSDRYSFVRAADLGWYAGLLHAPTGHLGTELIKVGVPGDRHYSGDDFLALVALICSDGYAGSAESIRNWVSFCCFHKKRYPMVAQLAQSVGFSEKPDHKGNWYRYNAGALAAWVRENCYVRGQPHNALAKKVPDIVKCASRRQIEHFLSFFGDKDHTGDGERFYSSSKQMIDDLQELHLRVGKRGSIGSRGPRTAIRRDGVEIRGSESHDLYVSKTDRLCIDKKKHIETDHYKGLVYCATVPNGTLITRRNGSILISSNCWMHSGVSALILARAVANLPYVSLSAYGPACIIKDFQDEGGWGAQGVDFLFERGCPSEEFWPQQSTSKKNDNTKTWENAALHKVTEGWIDLAAAQYDRNLSKAQFVTCLLSNSPCTFDANWWGHSICAMDIIEGQSTWGELRNENGKLLSLQEFNDLWEMDNVEGGYATRIWNSWGDSWSENGSGLLVGSKAWPDGAVALRSSTPSVK